MSTSLRFVVACVALSACASGPQIAPEQRLADLAAATHTPVGSPDDAAANSLVVQGVVDHDTLMRMARHEVEEAIGRGETCSRHPRCGTNGFNDDDWFYSVGTQREGYAGAVPILIVGFDREGRVTRVWNLRMHD